MLVKSAALKIVAVTIIGVAMVVALEVAARWIGLGTPILYYNDAWGGQRPLPRQSVERIGGARVTVDDNGFRAAKPPVPGALRILYIGDSVTWGGSMVDDAALFTEIAAEVIRRTERPVYAMNAGVNGTALVNHAEIFLRAVPADSVDILVWLFPWNDAFRPYATVSNLWPPTGPPRFALVEVIDHLLLRFWIPSSRKYVSFPGNRERRLARNLEAMRTVVAEAGRRRVPMIVGITPRRVGRAMAPLSEDAKTLLKELATSGVRVFDAVTVLGDVGANIDRYYLDEVHFTVEGHRVIGNALGAMLVHSVMKLRS